ncbi:ROK family transcriptional regulator [Streptomyces sp. NPDC094032]|uniref:ROK family transcriptional regulator n=1 Tax=Streptomyces sp. NPDC094032 TaxID=3155308 RepID=UPI00332A6B9D
MERGTGVGTGAGVGAGAGAGARAGAGAGTSTGPGTGTSPGAGAGAAAGSGPSGVNLPALRSHNAALLLDLLRTAGREGISRLELAERTGLTPQAVSKITARLRSEGLAADAGRRASTGGKPATVLRLVPEAGHAIGLHLDRDELTAVLLDLAGVRVALRRAPLDLGAGAEPVLTTVRAEVAALLGPEAPRPLPVRLLGVGVAMPGPLDHRAGTPGRVTGFPQWDGFPLRDELARRLGAPVVLDKDTNAAALGLALRPGAPGSFAYVHLGTGLGAGLVLGGAVLRGGRTGAGELGHQTVQLDGPACDCGGRGCLEVLCLAALARGDLDGAARVLGTGAANLVRLLDVDRVLLGGRAVLAAPEAFARGTREVLGGLGLPADVAVAAGPYAVAEGAAQLILAPVFGREPSGLGGEPRMIGP